MIKNVYWSLCKVPVILVQFWRKTWIFLTNFRKTLRYKINKNSPNGSRGVPCRQTDMTKLRVTFLNFADAPKRTPKSQYRSNLRRYTRKEKHSGEDMATLQCWTLQIDEMHSSQSQLFFFGPTCVQSWSIQLSQVLALNHLTHFAHFAKSVTSTAYILQGSPFYLQEPKFLKF